jgi:DNA-directed RNA polymerase subunit H (RpoH/RPB5)
MLRTWTAELTAPTCGGDRERSLCGDPERDDIGEHGGLIIFVWLDSFRKTCSLQKPGKYFGNLKICSGSLWGQDRMQSMDPRAAQTLLEMMRDWGTPVRHILKDEKFTFFESDPAGERSALLIVITAAGKEAQAVLSAKEHEDVAAPIHRVIAVAQGPKRRFPKLKAYGAAVFAEEELFFNPQRHNDVPALALLSEEEVAVVSEAFCASAEQFPAMLASDFQARYFGLRPGDVVRLTRKTDLGLQTVYRTVRPDV